MRTILLIILLMNSAFLIDAQNVNFKTFPDPKNGVSNMLVGELQFEDIANDSSCSWFSINANAYKADTNIIKGISKAINGYELVVFAGTWCEDTQHLLPQLFKVITQAKIPNLKIQLYGVDRKKQALNVEHLLYKIEKVPTIIIIKNHREVGRIVESVEGTIEESLLRILQKDISSGTE
jgi:thiol-disulfide isomerase/thioredoxin